MKINRNITTHKPPYTVIVIDATDAYYYADIMGEWKTFDVVNDLYIAKELADALFVTKNYGWKSIEAMNNCDGGFDIRVYDENRSCVYAAHEKYKTNWIGIDKKLEAELDDYGRKLLDDMRTIVREKEMKKEEIQENTKPNSPASFTLHGKDAEMASKAFFSEKGQKSHKEKKSRSKNKVVATIVVAIYSVVLSLLFFATKDYSQNTSVGFGILFVVGNVILSFITVGIVKLLGKLPIRRVSIDRKYQIIGGGLTLLLLALYWFSIRPSNIRSDCATYARSKNSYAAMENNYFRLCLVQHGMQPESMFVNMGR